MISRFFFVVNLFFLPLTAFCQQEMGLHFMRNVWQSSLTNPALQPDQRLMIGLGSVAYQLYQPDILLSNYIIKEQDGSKYLDVDGFLANMPDQTHLEGGVYIETLRLGMKLGKWKFGIHHAIVNQSSATYPKDLIGLAWQGNAPYIGDTLFIGPDLDITSYNEIVLQGAYSLPKLTIGAGVKVLSGIHQITSEKTFFSLYTDTDIYQLDVNTDYLVHTSGLIDYMGFKDSTFLPEVNTNTDFRFTENMGLAFDLGFKYSPTNKLDINASIIGLGGAIKWKKDARSYYSNGTYNYAGEDIQFLLETNSISIDTKLDTIKEIFDFKENSITYSTRLPVSSYISALYRFNDKWQAGALAFIGTYKNVTKTAFSLNGNFLPTQWLSLGASLGYRYKRFDQLGINFALKLGPVQLYGVTDNVITAFSPGKNHITSGRIGINLVFSSRGGS
jgi:hypothetical protein